MKAMQPKSWAFQLQGSRVLNVCVICVSVSLCFSLVSLTYDFLIFVLVSVSVFSSLSLSLCVL